MGVFKGPSLATVNGQQILSRCTQPFPCVQKIADSCQLILTIDISRYTIAKGDETCKRQSATFGFPLTAR